MNSVSASQPRDSGLQVRLMIQDMMQQVDLVMSREEELNNIAMDALETVDNIISINQDPPEFGQGQTFTTGDDTGNCHEDIPFVSNAVGECSAMQDSICRKEVLQPDPRECRQPGVQEGTV